MENKFVNNTYLMQELLKMDGFRMSGFRKIFKKLIPIKILDILTNSFHY